MVDLFIICSQRDRVLAGELAGDLARFLSKFSCHVWWDHNLVGAVEFRDQIKQELAAAKAAIVIWSANSVESKFVVDAAGDAKQAKKLLPTRAPDLDPNSIPPGCRQLQTYPIDKPDMILRALEEFGVHPSNAPAPQQAGPITLGTASVDPANVADAEQFAAWELIKNSRNPGPLRDFLEAFKGGLYEAEAWRCLHRLELEAWAALDVRSQDALTAHIAAYPDGFSVWLAQALLDEMQQGADEETALHQVEAKPTSEALPPPLKLLPLSERADTVGGMPTPASETESRASRWALIQEDGFSEQLRSFIDEFKAGPEVVEAQKRLVEQLNELEASAWDKVCDSRVPAEVIKFLGKHPTGVYCDRAIALLRGMPQRAEAEAWEAARAGGAAEAGFRAAYPKSARFVSVGQPPARAGEPEAQARAVEPYTGTTARSRWRLALWAAALLGTLAAIGALIALEGPMRSVDGYAITLTTLVGLLAAGFTGMSVYWLGTASSVRRGLSIELSSAAWHFVAMMPLGLWYVAALHAYPHQRRGNLDNMDPGAIGEQTAVVIAIAVALLILIAIASWIPTHWRLRSLLYFGLVGPSALIAYCLSWQEVAYGPGISDNFLTAALPESAILAAALLSLFCTERFIWNYRQKTSARETSRSKEDEAKVPTHTGMERLSRSIPVWSTPLPPKASTSHISRSSTAAVF